MVDPPELGACPCGSGEKFYVLEKADEFKTTPDLIVPPVPFGLELLLAKQGEALTFAVVRILRMRSEGRLVTASDLVNPDTAVPGAYKVVCRTPTLREARYRAACYREGFIGAFGQIVKALTAVDVPKPGLLFAVARLDGSLAAIKPLPPAPVAS
jgi:hypothetical protein